MIDGSEAKYLRGFSRGFVRRILGGSPFWKKIVSTSQMWKILETHNNSVVIKHIQMPTVERANSDGFP